MDYPFAEADYDDTLVFLGGSFASGNFQAKEIRFIGLI
jgi:hypothetical protein